jgi:Fe-S oxidoreductase
MARLIEQKRLDVKPLERKVTYHDPCDIGRNAHIFDEPRFIMSKIPGLELVEMENNREYCTCCGSGGNLLVSNEDMSLAIAARKMREIMATGARTAVTACPSCIRAISMAKTTEKVELDVLDITELLWKAVDG